MRVKMYGELSANIEICPAIIVIAQADKLEFVLYFLSSEVNSVSQGCFLMIDSSSSTLITNFTIADEMTANTKDIITNNIHSSPIKKTYVRKQKIKHPTKANI